MKAYEAQGIIVGCRNGQISEQEAYDLLMDPENLSVFRIITNVPDPENEHLGPKHPHFNVLSPVERIETQILEKTIRVDDTTARVVRVPRHTAHGFEYVAPDGRKTHDMCMSGAEKIIFDDTGESYTTTGAATALLSRLLEAHASA